jgi:hypothetical protein
MKNAQSFQRLLITGSMVAYLIFLSGSVYAQTDTIPESIDPKAKEILLQLSKSLTESNSFRFLVQYYNAQKEDNTSFEKSDIYQFAMQRPNKLIMTHKEGLFGPTVVCDGQILMTYMPTMNQYLKEPAPANYKILFEQGKSGMVLAQSIPLIDAFFDENPYQKIIRDVNTIEYQGIIDLDGVSCHLILFTQKDMDWKLWLENKNHPVLKKIEADITKQIAQVMPEKLKDNSLRYEFTWTFSDWQFNEQEPENIFHFSPPAAAKEVKDFTNSQAEQKHRLLGQTASNFKLSNLDNKEIELKNHIGKDVVILDFWALRCPPCRVALPILAEIAQQYKDKSVVVYAVNSEDNGDSIKSFLQAQNINIDVLLARNDNVSSLYGVEYLPQTVIIDKKGQIQSIHTGLLPNLKEALTEEIETLRNDKDLIRSADLACTEISFTPDSPQADKPIQFTCTLENKGTDTIYANTYNIVLLIENKQVFISLGNVDIPANYKIQYKTNAKFWNLKLNTDGSYSYKLLVIPGGQNREQNPTDIIMEGTLTVKP